MSPENPSSDGPAEPPAPSNEGEQRREEPSSEDERKPRGSALGGILTGDERQAIVRAPPVEESITPRKRIYQGEAADREREARERAENRNRDRAVRRMKRALEDIAWALPWLTVEEKRALALVMGGSQTTALERIMVEINATVGWEALPPGVRGGRGTIAEGLARAQQGGLKNYHDHAKRRNVGVEIRLLGDDASWDYLPPDDDPEQPFRPARDVAEDAVWEAKMEAHEQRRAAQRSGDSAERTGGAKPERADQGAGERRESGASGDP